MAPQQPPAPQPKQFPCSGCGAVMEFAPAQGLLKCGHCGHTEPVPAEAAPAVAAHPLEEFLALVGDAHLRPLSGQALQVQCTGCGSVVSFEPPQVAGACPFCGANVVTQPKAADPLVAPDGLLPFKVPKDQAQTQVRAWLQSRWFAPGALKRLARQEGIAGLYLPFWSYDADTVSRYTGQRGENYTETETYTDSDGNTQTREVTRTTWWPTAGQVSRGFRDVLIAASRSVPEKKLNGLAPWDLESLSPYEPAYLAGFKAQRYQVELPDGFEDAKSVMARVIDRDVRQESDTSFVAPGSLDLDRLHELLGFRPEEDTESTTVGGLVAEWLGHVPQVGESVEREGIRIEVLAGNELRVEQVRVSKLEAQASV